MEGFWSIVLSARGRLPVYGVVVFVGDRIFDGDPCFYWTGTYATRGGKIEATLEVIRHSGSAVGNIFGDSVTRLALVFRKCTRVTSHRHVIHRERSLAA
jgi:hypothetical protein